MKKIYQERLSETEREYNKWHARYELTGDDFALQMSNYLARRYNNLRRLIDES